MMLIYGGSQGSKAINDTVAHWLSGYTMPELFIIWATGEGTYAEFAHLETDRVKDSAVPRADSRRLCSSRFRAQSAAARWLPPSFVRGAFLRSLCHFRLLPPTTRPPTQKRSPRPARPSSFLRQSSLRSASTTSCVLS